MNPVQKILTSLTDEDLKAIIRDIIVLDETGVLPSGAARNLANRLVQEVSIPFNDALTIAQREPMRIAAFKWASA